MAFWDIFKSSSKAIDTAANVIENSADGIIKGVDKVFFTEEEKADAKQKWFSSWLELQKTLANEGTPTAIARRVLAFLIMGVFLFLVLLCVLLWKFDKEWSNFIYDILGRMEYMATAVVATYFIKDAFVKAFQAKK